MSIIAVLLIVFTSIHCPLVQFPKHAHTSVHTILFVVPLHHFLHLHLNRMRPAFEAASKVFQTGKYPKSVS